MNCPFCNEPLIQGWGSKSNGFYIVSDYPNEDEEKDQRWWAGNAGQMLQSEFMRAGIIPHTFYFTGAWKHPVSRKAEEINFMSRALQEELKDARGILLLGSAISLLMDVDPPSTYGMMFTLDQFPKAEFIVSADNIKSVGYSVIGDFRLGFERFIKEVKKCQTAG